MKKITFIVLLIGLISISTSAQDKVISVFEAVKIKNNKRVEALYYYENNWKALRIKAIEKGYIHSFELLETNADDSANFDIILITRYADQAQYDKSEEHFQELIKQGGDLKLLNDKKPADFRENVFVKVGKSELEIKTSTPLTKTSFSNLNAEKQINKLLSKYDGNKTPGVAVAVVKDGKIIFKKGFGMANLEYDVPITPSTVFHVASVSKQFTTASILLLEKEGKLSLDDDVRKYIPELPDFGKTITLRHLATHTSGLKDQWALLTLAGWRMDDVITTEQILKVLNRQKTLNFEPGSKFLYSNSGFTLLAEVIARVTGQSFAEFTKKNIFVPLKMKNTQFYDDHEKMVKNRAYSYAKVGHSYKKRNLNYATVGATSLFTTAEDLSLWAMNFENPIIGDSEIIQKLQQPALLNNGKPATLAIINGEPIYHAMGQFVRNYRGLDIVNHTGRDAGFRAYLVRFPSEKFSVIVLGNDADFNSFEIGLKIAEIYLKDKLQPSKSASDKDANPADSSPKATLNISADDLSEFVGQYQSEELSTEYSIIVSKNKKLTIQHFRIQTNDLEFIGNDKFIGQISFPVEIEFDRNTKKEITGFRISNFGAKNIDFKKIDKPQNE